MAVGLRSARADELGRLFGVLRCGGMLVVPPGSGACREVGDGQMREHEDDAAGLAYLSAATMRSTARFPAREVREHGDTRHADWLGDRILSDFESWSRGILHHLPPSRRGDACG
jgi:hypothetical protein